jgi:hypothetical protein
VPERSGIAFKSMQTFNDHHVLSRRCRASDLNNVYDFLEENFASSILENEEEEEDSEF